MIANRHFDMFLIVCLGFLLASCSQESNNVSRQQSLGSETAANIHAEALAVTSYGPDKTRAGVSFNTQPDHQAALWIHVNQSLADTDAAIYWDGIRLNSAISGAQITASVPAKLYAVSGKHKLQVRMTQNGQPKYTGVVDFSVK